MTEFHESKLWPITVRKSSPLPEQMNSHGFTVALEYFVAGSRDGYVQGHREGYRAGLEEGYNGRVDDIREAIERDLRRSIIARPGPRFDQLCELRGEHERARKLRRRWAEVGFKPISPASTGK